MYCVSVPNARLVCVISATKGLALKGCSSRTGSEEPVDRGGAEYPSLLARSL